MNKILIILIPVFLIGQKTHFGNFNIIDTLKIDSLVVFWNDEDTIKTESMFSFEGGVYYTGDMDVVGYITGKKSGVYAFLSERDTTSIVTVDSLHFVQGSFANSPMEDFKIANEMLVYTGSTQYFEVLYFASLSSNVANTTVHIAIVNDDSVYSDQKMGTFFKNIDQVYLVSGNLVFEVEQNDTIRIKVEANNICDLDFRHFTTSIKEFFD